MLGYYWFDGAMKQFELPARVDSRVVVDSQQMHSAPSHCDRSGASHAAFDTGNRSIQYSQEKVLG